MSEHKNDNINIKETNNIENANADNIKLRDIKADKVISNKNVDNKNVDNKNIDNKKSVKNKTLKKKKDNDSKIIKALSFYKQKKTVKLSEEELKNLTPLTQKEYRKMKKDIAKLPPPSFNNPEKAQPVLEVPQLADEELQKIIVDPTRLETPDRQLVETESILQTPGVLIEKIDKKKKVKVFRTLMPLVKKHWFNILLCLLFAIIYSTFELLIPIYLGKSLDNIIGVGNVDFAGLKVNIIYLGIAILGFGIFRWLTVYFNNALSFKSDRSIRIELFKKLRKVPLKYIDVVSHGDLQSRMINDVDEVSKGFLVGLTTVFDALVSIVLTVYLMFQINASISTVIIILTPLSVITTAYIAYKSNKFFRQQAKTLGDASGVIVEMLGSQRVVKSFNYEDRSIEKFEKINKELAYQNEKSMFFSSLANPSSRFINGVIYAVVAIMGTLYAIKGVLSVGSIAVLLSFANKYIQPFNEISDVFSDLQSAYASARRVVHVLNLDEEVSDKQNKVLKKSNGNIEFQNVYFSYVEHKKLIENLNLTVKPGQRVAIVGPTGSGKSTLINLLMRFYDVNSGNVFVSNKEIKSITRNSLRDKFGMVLQDSYLFNMSIMDNIRYGKPDASLKEVIRAAKRAYAHEYIQTLENGYDTMVTEGGANLSSGQKQLICIARIMLVNPPMLILDEATSNIDTRTELYIQDAFNKIMKGKTSFIVAHRLSTIVASDLILVINKGNIVEQGTHEQLLQLGGFYYNLYNSQFSQV